MRYDMCLGINHDFTGDVAVARGHMLGAAGRVMAFPGALLFGLGVGSCYVGRKCRLSGVCVVATTVWLAQLAGVLRRITQVDFCWCMSGGYVGVSICLSVVCIEYLPSIGPVVVQCGARVEASVVPLWVRKIVRCMRQRMCHGGASEVPIFGAVSRHALGAVGMPILALRR